MICTIFSKNTGPPVSRWQKKRPNHDTTVLEFGMDDCKTDD